MSALGHRRTSAHVRVMSALPPKADIAESGWHVCFVPKADIQAAFGYYCWWVEGCSSSWSITVKLPRRKFLRLTAGSAALPVASQFAWAQTYPSRAVRIIVGFPAGSSSDITARLIGQWLSERLGQQFIVEDRPGAGTNIAAETV